jgi:hypothetical protein
VPLGSYLNSLTASGYVELTSPTVKNLFHWGYPVTQPVAPIALPLLPLPSIATIQGFYSTGGLTQDPSRGTIGIYVTDCSDSPAPGVTLATDPKDQLASGPLYGTTGLLGATGRSPDNIVGFFNVPAGRVTLIATPLALNKVSSRLVVTVRPGYFTQVILRPTP